MTAAILFLFHAYSSIPSHIWRGRWSVCSGTLTMAQAVPPDCFAHRAAAYPVMPGVAYV